MNIDKLLFGSLIHERCSKYIYDTIMECLKESEMIVGTNKLPVERFVKPQTAGRNGTIEECAKHLEKLADEINEIVFAKRHILQEDTTELLRIEKEIRRNSAIELRKIKR